MPPKADGSAPLPRFGRVKNNLKMGLVGLPNVGMYLPSSLQSLAACEYCYSAPLSPLLSAGVPKPSADLR
jgi:hypothetical protein